MRNWGSKALFLGVIGLAVLGSSALFACGFRSTDPEELAGDRPSTVSPGSDQTDDLSPRRSKHSNHEKELPYRSVSEALTTIRKKLSVPVILPSGISQIARLVPDDPVWIGKLNGKTAARLSLHVGPHDYLAVQFGVALFDGCGADVARPTTVGSQPALYVSRGKGKEKYTDLIWPATRTRWAGMYGLEGTFGLQRIRDLAESMQNRIVGRARDYGC